VADPANTPVTGTVTLVIFARIVTAGGTVATPGLLELKLMFRPPEGAGVEMVNVVFCVAIPVIVKLAGEKLMVGPGPTPEPEVTCTLAGVNPLADAVMIDTPALTPVTAGARLALVEPCGIKILSGAMVTFELSLLLSPRNTPP